MSACTFRGTDTPRHFLNSRRAEILLLIILVAWTTGEGCATAGPCTPNLGPPVTTPCQNAQGAERWPIYSPDPDWAVIAGNAASEYASKGYTYKDNLQNYSTSDDYLRFSVTDDWKDVPGKIRLDQNGVPMVNYSGIYYYNPVTVAEFSLSEHGKYLTKSEPDLTKFWAGVKQLELLQDSGGALRYQFPFFYYLTAKTFQPGWTSGMAQGMALSVYARAYLLTSDPQYLDRGNAILSFMLTEVSSGGTLNDMRSLDPSLQSDIIYDEYPALPSGYTLNGFMFAMLGMYDWSQMPNVGSVPKKSFDQAMHTLTHILPYYDIGGYSAYDMGHITYRCQPHIGVTYHAVHIYLLHALGSLTHDPTLKHFEDLWASYVPQ
jgi:heparosan-N-sulfate-glucuronate 5-epimerase